MFGATLGEHRNEPEARDQVLTEGLASLTERWTLLEVATGAEEVVCILEADPSRVLVARGYYSLPGVPTLTISAAQIASGEWDLRRPR